MAAVFRRFPHVTQAEMVQSVLAGSDIESFIDIPYSGGMFPHYAFGSGWVSLMVAEEDVERAEEVLASADLDSVDITDHEP